MKLSKILLFFILLLISIPAYLVYRYNAVINSPIGDKSEKVSFNVDEGMSGYQVVNKLASEGLIKQSDINFLKAYLRLNKIPHFQEGKFNFPRNLTVKELFETLQNPESTDIWVTIQEGLMAEEIATILSDEFSEYPEAVFSKERFTQLLTNPEYISTLELPEGITTLEGFLFPDRYLMPQLATEEYVINTLVGHFKSKVGEISYNDLKIASMVEREGLTDQDRPLIADVIKRRLAEGWLLQIDATLLYYHEDWKHVLTEADLKTDHPYNTYTRPGLPPTPISNPGLSAIRATLSPTPNQYYYYIHDSNGKSYFAKTLEEHNNNVATHLR